VGGLTAAALLAAKGKDISVFEKIHHIGGTSHIFRRKDFKFPMGPLSFSHPKLVKEIIEEAGIKTPISFERNHFQLITPDIDIIYSREWNYFKELLQQKFPKERTGLNTFFNILDSLIDAISSIQDWHPDFLIGKQKELAINNLDLNKDKYDLIEKYSNITSNSILNDLISDDSLKRLLGSQGSYKPVMSMVHLAFMWNVMSINGIWFPSCGIHGINELLASVITKNDGEINLNTPVKEILVGNGKITKIKTVDNKTHEAEWIIANADYKRVFLELIDESSTPSSHIEAIKATPYTGSEFCVYLGINPTKVDLSKMRVTHLFYRSEIGDLNSIDPENFKNREIEICLWSNKSSKFAPNSKKSLVLRVNMPYSHFQAWRTGEKKRKDGYQEYKIQLAKKLIKTVEEILPGLSNSIEVMEIATPLTYQDWGQRYKGSVAGWTRDIKKIRLNTKLLTHDGIENLLVVGIYSILEPFLGGYPVSIYTGKLAADFILEKETQ
ncbi:MAG: NAD(P)-binding protein, partial [Candidatus Lokiarchaeota archaeon]|nr:NAD(P)-binding protein [Candidatus Lokiarchaeota archaeon]MBD3342233.1 NAD(P)-binding protein [Candidatus Lokiarchaeota archaeon]